MPKRKLERGRLEAPEVLSSDSSSNESFFTKRTRLEEIQDESYESDVEETTIPFSDSEENMQNGFETHPLHSTLSLSAKINTYGTKTREFEEGFGSNEGCSQYAGFQSFMRSFQFFSDEESPDSEQEMKLNITQDFNNRARLLAVTTTSGDIEEQVPKLEFLQSKLHNNNCRILQCLIKSTEVIFIDHPISVPLVGYLRVTLLAGKASIQGFKLKKNKPIILFSQRQTGIASITTNYSDEEEVLHFGQSEVIYKLKELLSPIPMKDIKASVKLNMKFSSVVVCLEKLPLPPNLEFLQLYFPSAVSFKTKNNIMGSSKYTAFQENEKYYLKFGGDYEEIFSSLHRHLCRINGRQPGQPGAVHVIEDNTEVDSSGESNLPKVTGFRILVRGPKKSGKSTMLKYLMNCFLNKYSEVYYLDTDCGQTEFTPAGVISLVKVTEPVFGPAYTHLRKPLKMTYIGSTTVDHSPPMYLKTVRKMINYFNSNFPDSILLVNTLGWVTGIGEMILESTRKFLLPAVEIELSADLSTLKTYLEGNVLKFNVGFERSPESSMHKGDNRPGDLRDFAFLSHLGGCQNYFKQPTFVNEFRTVCLCWEDIAVYNFNKRLPRNRFYEALNSSVVALCNVDNSLIMASAEIPEYPNTLIPEPDNECLGFGIVRCVQEDKRILHIVTPLGLDSLAHVNAIMSGNILLPRPVFIDQPLEDIELDYTDTSKGHKVSRKPIRNRARQHRSLLN